MRGARTTVKSTRESGTDWKRLGKRTKAEMLAGIAQDPDACVTDEAFWKGARVVTPKTKEAITIRLDGDVLAWFRRTGSVISHGSMRCYGPTCSQAIKSRWFRISQTPLADVGNEK